MILYKHLNLAIKRLRQTRRKVRIKIPKQQKQKSIMASGVFEAVNIYLTLKPELNAQLQRQTLAGRSYTCHWTQTLTAFLMFGMFGKHSQDGSKCNLSKKHYNNDKN